MEYNPTDEKEIAVLFSEFTQHIDSFMYLVVNCLPESIERKRKAEKVVERILETLEKDIAEMRVDEIREYVMTVKTQIAEFKIIVTH